MRLRVRAVALIRREEQYPTYDSITNEHHKYLLIAPIMQGHSTAESILLP
jgi:hypothetical protein